MTDTSLETLLQSELEQIKDPESGRSITQRKQVVSQSIDDSRVAVKIGITTFANAVREDFQAAVVEKLKTRFPNHEVEVELVEHDRPPTPLGTVALTAKAVLAVGSGKGGVGKSTAALSLAMALHRTGSKVGLLDADVYGPSVPHLTGVRGEVFKEGEKIAPVDFNGIPLMSIGFMIPPDEAVIWRGPMLHSTVTTFVRDVAWGDLDFLIIDMPPGTGDIALSLSQLLPITGSIVVCTPQEVALIDAIKAVAMFEKVKIPVVGMIENMSSFICPDNNKRYDIFGKGGAKEFAEQANIPFLGEIPINIQLRERGDAGSMGDNFDDPNVGPYLTKIAYQLVKHLTQKAAANPTRPQLPVLG